MELKIAYGKDGSGSFPKKQKFHEISVDDILMILKTLPN